MSRPNCCVRGCHELCDYTVSIWAEKRHSGNYQAREEFDLCGEHYNEFSVSGFLANLNLADIPDKTKEKVVFT